MALGSLALGVGPVPGVILRDSIHASELPAIPTQALLVGQQEQHRWAVLAVGMCGLNIPPVRLRLPPRTTFCVRCFLQPFRVPPRGTRLACLDLCGVRTLICKESFDFLNV